MQGIRNDEFRDGVHNNLIQVGSSLIDIKFRTQSPLLSELAVRIYEAHMVDSSTDSTLLDVPLLHRQESIHFLLEPFRGLAFLG